MRRLPLFLVAFSAACAGNPGSTRDAGNGSDGGQGVREKGNFLEIVPLDVWGRDHGDVQLTLGLAPPRFPDPDLGPEVVLVRLDPGGAFELPVEITAQDYFGTYFTVTYDGGSDKDAFVVRTPTGRARAITGESQRIIGEVDAWVFSVYVGLDHAWLASTAPAPTHNLIEVYLDGESGWSAVHDQLLTAQERVSWATWWWESDFELWRAADHAYRIEADRRRYTVMAVADAQPGVEWKVLINRFWGDNTDFAAFLNTDSELRTKAETAADGFEVILQGNLTSVPVGGQYFGQPKDYEFAQRVLANPRYGDRTLHGNELGRRSSALTLDAASYHQKATVVDGKVAFVSGMNTKATDWDDLRLAVFNEKRMDFESTNPERLDVLFRKALPDLGPRKDYMVRIEGPMVQDVEAVVAARWEASRTAGALFAENATPFTVLPRPAEPAAGVLSQLVVTLPEPVAEMSIRETHAKAFAQARDYIYIEDQYFRAPLMQDVIVARMLEVPDLRLIVVTKEVGTLDGGLKFTYLGDALLRALFPDRYLLLVLKTADLVTEVGTFFDTVDVHLVNVDVHSKIRIVDDRYVSLGSCNFNNRGYLFEGEMNVSIFDENVGRDTRERVFAQIAGPIWAAQLTGDAINDFDVLKRAAEDNEAIMAWWELNAGSLDAPQADAARLQSWPTGFVYPLTISPDYLLEVGPDMF